MAINARLLSRAGFVEKVMAGVWAYLPLGYRVLDNINRILREEMNLVGGQELLLTSLQPKLLWDKTGRWQGLRDVMYQFDDGSGHDLGLAITHEEPLTDMARKVISSYKDLPVYLYQIQTKFRNEPRAKSGLLRSREFLMKDLYSFDRDENGLNRSYESLKDAYRRFFKRCDLDAKIVEASGGTFTQEFTHEFQVLSDSGEDEIVYCKKCSFAQNKEIISFQKGSTCPLCGQLLVEGKSIEVGHIYKLGTKYSDALSLFYADEKGTRQKVSMGSYGIGPGRVMGTIVEIHHDDHGIVWPYAVSPYDVHLLGIHGQEEKVAKMAEKVYKEFLAKGIEVLYDDRVDKSAGEKFADADLMGITWRVVVSTKTISSEQISVKRRSEGGEKLMRLQEFSKSLLVQRPRKLHSL